MSTETEDDRIERLERALRQHLAIHRRRMRWWRHMREYVSVKRLLVNGLVKRQPEVKALPDHPPWSSNWWQAERPIRFVKGVGR